MFSEAGDGVTRYTVFGAAAWGIVSHEGYKNTIELPVGNNVVPLRSDTIRLVQNGCSFYGLRFEDPNQHLKDFLKYVDSLELDGANRERMRLRLFKFSLRDQASNWLERLPAGSITTWEDLTTQSLSEAWTRFKDLLQKVPHHGIDLWLQVKKIYDHVNPVTRRTIDQSAGGKLRDQNAEESWALLKDLALYDNESWNDQRNLAKPVKAIALPQDVSSTSDHHLIELENQIQCLMEAHFAPRNLHPEQAFVEYASSCTDEAGENEEEETDNSENIHVNPPTPPNPSVSFITENVLKLNSFFESLGLVPQSSDIEVVCTKGDDGEVMFIEIIRKNDDSRKEEPEEEGSTTTERVGVFGIWKAIGGHTRDLGSFGEETDKTTDLHQHFSRLCSQRLEMASQDTRGAVTIHPMTVSQEIMTASARTTQPKI
ncbi:hypothetical protein Tco_1393939 [Tanacetum coccineum]